ncbi:uncharacterized protein TRAVEDRAFT_48588 [Trametes versicolor FP-101664 SS1]|uniref:uncharacterized protein n=1 Tax=Trametes versicolor (strain FP-101664) TaxID=717944 RepID=UPI00046232A3|nr:uncharacterized protein TRAVEDRAFT_48588 [Trametes versicolor FP-101664 SS1]EIW57549.1 hypothetical protein TRAVEDRAFT_48588 [Trametes versicolor FP-101664 SS1]
MASLNRSATALLPSPATSTAPIDVSLGSPDTDVSHVNPSETATAEHAIPSAAERRPPPSTATDTAAVQQPPLSPAAAAESASGFLGSPAFAPRGSADGAAPVSESDAIEAASERAAEGGSSLEISEWAE